MTEIDAVITTYGRPGALASCVSALAAQSRKPTRIIVVDDCSPTPAVDSLRELGQLGVPLDVIRCETNGGPARGRNIGVLASTADLILFIDDDVVGDRNLVAKHIDAHAKSSQPTAVIGPLRAPPDWVPTPWNYWEASTLDVHYARMERGEFAPTWRQFFTGNASVPRAEFVAAGGFNDALRRAEDVEAAIRMASRGVTFTFVADAVGWHYARRTRESWLAIPSEYARVDAAISRWYPDLRWLDVVEGELRQRNTLTRLSLRAFPSGNAGNFLTRAALRLSAVAFFCGMRGTSNALLSLVYSVEYTHGLDAAMAEAVASDGRLSNDSLSLTQGEVTPPMFNTTSTGSGQASGGSESPPVRSST